MRLIVLNLFTFVVKDSFSGIYDLEKKKNYFIFNSVSESYFQIESFHLFLFRRIICLIYQY